MQPAHGQRQCGCRAGVREGQDGGGVPSMRTAVLLDVSSRLCCRAAKSGLVDIVT